MADSPHGGVGRGTLEELKGLIHEHWAEVYRAGRRIELHGPLNPSDFAAAIAHELSLGPRDFPALLVMLERCAGTAAAGGAGAGAGAGASVVDMSRLRAFAAEADRVVAPDLGWLERCGGLKGRRGGASVNESRPATAGARRKYAIENHGSPFAIAGDARATLQQQRQVRAGREQRVLQALQAAADGEQRLTRAALSSVLAAHLQISDAENDLLLAAVDPRCTNAIAIPHFATHFLPELLKPKSLRRSILPPIPAAPRTPKHSRRAASPRTPGRTPQSTRASQLRRVLGSAVRTHHGQDPAACDWAASPRTHAVAGVRTAASSMAVPAPPPRPQPLAATTPANRRRPKTTVAADAVALGNVAPQ